jgi:glycosyltransferase involved in cell wall biosynthesis
MSIRGDALPMRANPVTPTAASRRLPITAIVLTRNEQRNLEACLSSIAEHVAQIVVVDSYSDDSTLEIARRYTPHVFQNTWTRYAQQYAWATRLPEIDQPWILRIDADERWTPEGFAELSRWMAEPDVNGIYVRMKIYFMGRFIRHGTFYPNLFLRAYRREAGEIEQRWMDEHIEVTGRTVVSSIDVVEANYDRQKNLTLFIDKHNRYATREAIDLLLQRQRARERPSSMASLFRTRTEAKRWLKDNVYARAPLFVRPTAYFAYRYVLRGGFLDGTEGFIFHSLQGLWYRFLVDAKIYQIEQLMKAEGRSLAEVVKDHLGYTL